VRLFSFLDSTRRKLALLPFILYTPLQSATVGTPLPLPAMFSISPDQMAVFNFISFLVTLSGTLTGVAFWVEKRNTKKIEELKADIKEKYEALRRHIDTTEDRTCSLIVSRNKEVERRIDENVKSAKELEDTKFANVEKRLNDNEKALEEVERYYHKSNRITGDNNNKDDSR
jgi:hypothetical protein